jgi:hypothetical protein
MTSSGRLRMTWGTYGPFGRPQAHQLGRRAPFWQAEHTTEAYMQIAATFSLIILDAFD